MPAPRYRNSWPHDTHRLIDILCWKLGIKSHEPPAIPDAPNHPAQRITVKPEEIRETPASGWRVMWLGHSSFLLQGAGASILIDPIFSSHCAPLPFPSLQRRVAPPCELEDLPAIDAVLLTHSHYDHLDLSTLRRIGSETPIMIAEGHARWLARIGFPNVTEIPWHQSHELLPGIKVSATPAQHFTARTPWDRDQGHWCGWLIEGAGCKLWHAGDTGYCPAFREIGERHGPIDFGMIPIGAYQPRAIMRPMHLNPEEAVSTFMESRCRRAAAMHWGTFILADEPLGEPPLRLKAALAANDLPEDAFVAGHVGQSWTIQPEPESGLTPASGSARNPGAP